MSFLAILWGGNLLSSRQKAKILREVSDTAVAVGVATLNSPPFP